MYVYYIYILRCPDTGGVRYVGRTIYPKQRERQHCNHFPTNRNTKVLVWTNSLKERGKQPVFEIVESGAVPDHERDWITKFKAEGHELLNAHLNRY